jgi:hypothetical protein
MIGVISDFDNGAEVLVAIANDDELAEKIYGFKNSPAKMTRELVVKPSGLTEFWPIIASIQDNLQSTTAITSSLIDWAQNQYFITAIQNVSASDASVLSSYRIFGV